MSIFNQAAPLYHTAQRISGCTENIRYAESEQIMKKNKKDQETSYSITPHIIYVLPLT